MTTTDLRLAPGATPQPRATPPPPPPVAPAAQQPDGYCCYGCEQLAKAGATQHQPRKPFRVRIEDIRLPANVPAGMNPLRVMSLAYQMRGSSDDIEGPIEMRLDPDGGWRLVDGRHRYIAAVIAGRPDVLCVEAR